MASLSFPQRLDWMTAEEVAAAHAISRATVFEHLKTGKLTKADCSRTEWTRKMPGARYTYFHVLEVVLHVLIKLTSREYVAGYLAHHYPGLARAIVRAVVPADAFHPEGANEAARVAS